MNNIELFVATTAVYFIIWKLSQIFSLDPDVISLQRIFRELAIIALLCLPLNINGNVFTVLGNAESPKNAYSVFSLYQKAGTADRAFAVWSRLESPHKKETN